MTNSCSHVPSSTYRFQLTRSFPLRSARELLPYLQELGIEGICCSPLFDAVTPGGYDQVDPNRFHPEICSEEEFTAFCAELSKLGMKLILDVVPNHMGILGKKNRWWIDVLKRGEASDYAHFFDIDWKPLQGKVILPVLAGPCKALLEKGEIELVWEEGFWIRYQEHRFPVCPMSLPEEEAGILERFSGNPVELEGLLERQHYRLAYWKMAGSEINYRRFFNINELAAIRIEDESVLAEHHRTVFELIESGKVQGLRIDHPDGLFDPGSYLEKLRGKGATLVLTEKILGFQELLPEKWEAEGTVGYDFLNAANGLFIQKRNEKELTAVYNAFLGYERSFEDVLYERRKNYIEREMGSQIRMLCSLLEPSDFIKADLSRALQEIIACYPVYRTYIRPGAKERKSDSGYLEIAIEKARRRAKLLHPSLFDFLRSLLLEGNPEFAMRFQQITAPAMAKGFEDSTFYVYNRLISLNEVGGYPQTFGTTIEEFHAFNQQKQLHWPLGSLASSTHDTKFSEDARMRLHVLSEIPERWKTQVFEWKKRNQIYKTQVGEELFPDANAEYFLYQLMIALWPVSEERLWHSFFKSIREAGIYTSWMSPSKEYEAAAESFLRSIFQDKDTAFQEEIAEVAALNSLSAVVMKMGSCGIADLYQGDEILNFRHVDPDNRASVDYAMRKNLLGKSEEKKLWILSQSLNFRKRHKELFLKGEYLPLTIDNERAIGWIRKHGSECALVIAGRFFYGQKPWEGEVALPEDFPGEKLIHLYTKKSIPIHRRGTKAYLLLSEVLKEFPAAIFAPS